MFKVLDSIQTAPIRLFAVEGFKYEAGRVIDLVEHNNNPSCIPSDGHKPFGIVAGPPDKYGMVSVWYDTMTCQTDRFELSVTYEPKDLLYVSERGLLTTEKIYSDSHLVGKVLVSMDQDYLEFDWV